MNHRHFMFPNLTDLYRRYQAGETSTALAGEVGCSYVCLLMAFRRESLVIRGRSEAAKLGASKRERSDSERLRWLRNAIAMHDSDACQLWPFATNVKGYGQLYYGGRLVQAHRLAFFLAKGHWPIPLGCHSCDVPACFNPRHIFEGTQRDNMVDAQTKGRLNSPRGERNAKCKLTNALVRQIRSEYVPNKHGFGNHTLARKFGICHSTIWHIVTRRTWKHVA